ncbi:MAG: hypothetical protein JNG85_11705 [Spirochaetaceae bacterium]|nr:hypothetical protein [Spirochaetaceae bacterium]
MSDPAARGEDGSSPAGADRPPKSRRSRRGRGHGEGRTDERPDNASAGVQPAATSNPDAADQGARQDGESGEAKKSRSRRRRERRKEAKARGEGEAPTPRADRPKEERPGDRQSRGAEPRLEHRKGQRNEGKKPGTEERQRRSGQDERPRDGFRPAGERRDRDESRQRRQQPLGENRSRADRPRREDRPFREDRPYREDRANRADRPYRGAEDPYARPAPRRQARPEGIPENLDDELELPPGFRGPTGEPIGSRDRRGAFGKKTAPAVRVLERLSPSPESLQILAKLEAVIEEAAPIQAKHRAGLKGDIRGLWEELTSDRESRSADYLGTPPAMSAYLRYFMPWNVFRLSAIFSNADFCLPDNAVIVDVGSGPLTLPIALYASRPELREVPLTIYCMDRVERVLEAGKAVFETLCLRTGGRLPPWRIELRKEGFGGPLPERAHLLAAANVFNEFFWKDKRSLGDRAIDTARTLLSYLRENGSLFVMEPGDPRSGAFITSLRAALLAEGASPLGPCPHALSCPMPGVFRHLLPPEETRVVKGDPNAAPSRFVLPPVVMPKKRDKFPWCHFGVDTDQAPSWLQALSAEAGLPKERAVLSYLWAARGLMSRSLAGVPDPQRLGSEKERRARVGKGILVRVVSEPFGLPEGATGQYACSSLGYTLLRRPRGEDPYEPGDLLEVTTAPLGKNDEKSGAIILPT